LAPLLDEIPSSDLVRLLAESESILSPDGPLVDGTVSIIDSAFASSSSPYNNPTASTLHHQLPFINTSFSPPQQQQQERNSPQKQVRSHGGKMSYDDDQFDPDERQIRVLLKQNLKHFDLNGTIDFDKLTRELNAVDRNQSGILNRQQIEEVVYRVRLPLQRSLIFQVLEKHCRAHSKLYDWKSFVRYLQEQIFDLKQIQDRSSPIYAQYVPTREKWLDDLQREFHEKDRLRVIDRFVSNNEGVRSESTHPSALFTRFLRLANAMYTHRTNSNVSQEFVLPREEARRLFSCL